MRRSQGEPTVAMNAKNRIVICVLFNRNKAFSSEHDNCLQNNRISLVISVVRNDSITFKCAKYILCSAATAYAIVVLIFGELFVFAAGLDASAVDAHCPINPWLFWLILFGVAFKNKWFRHIYYMWAIDQSGGMRGCVRSDDGNSFGESHWAAQCVMWNRQQQLRSLRLTWKLIICIDFFMPYDGYCLAVVGCLDKGRCYFCVWKIHFQRTMYYEASAEHFSHSLSLSFEMRAPRLAQPFHIYFPLSNYFGEVRRACSVFWNPALHHHSGNFARPYGTYGITQAFQMNEWEKKMYNNVINPFLLFAIFQRCDGCGKAVSLRSCWAWALFFNLFIFSIALFGVSTKTFHFTYTSPMLSYRSGIAGAPAAVTCDAVTQTQHRHTSIKKNKTTKILVIK